MSNFSQNRSFHQIHSTVNKQNTLPKLLSRNFDCFEKRRRTFRLCPRLILVVFFSRNLFVIVLFNVTDSFSSYCQLVFESSVLQKFFRVWILRKKRFQILIRIDGSSDAFFWIQPIQRGKYKWSGVRNLQGREFRQGLE